MCQSFLVLALRQVETWLLWMAIGFVLGPKWELWCTVVVFGGWSRSTGVSRDQNEATIVAHEALEIHGAVWRRKGPVGEMRRYFSSNIHRQLHCTGRHLFQCHSSREIRSWVPVPYQLSKLTRSCGSKPLCSFGQRWDVRPLFSTEVIGQLEWGKKKKAHGLVNLLSWYSMGGLRLACVLALPLSDESVHNHIWFDQISSIKSNKIKSPVQRS